MRSFSSDNKNDIFLSGRTLSISTDLEAVMCVCKHIAQAVLGEMVLAKDKGMPYFETVWVGGPTSAAFEAAFRARVAEVDGVEEIASLTTEQVGDAMQYAATIVTVYGTGQING